MRNDANIIRPEKNHSKYLVEYINEKTSKLEVPIFRAEKSFIDYVLIGLVL